MENNKSPYFQSPNQNLGNELYLLQIKPDISANLGHGADAGYLFGKKDGEWARLREMTSSEHDQAWDQVSDMAILDASMLAQSKDGAKPSEHNAWAEGNDKQCEQSKLGLFKKISQWVGNRRAHSANEPLDSVQSVLKSTHQPKG